MIGIRYQGIRIIYLISKAFQSILCVQEKLSECCSRLSKRTYHWVWKVAFLLLKPKWYLNIKLEAFYQFSSNDNRKQWVLFYLESFLLISGISRFSFFVMEHIRKPEKSGKVFRSSFLEVLRLIICFEHFTRHFVLSRCNSQSVAQSYQLAFTIIYYYLESGFSGY